MLNVVALLGRLTADPELRTTQSGLSVCRFRVAVDRNITNEDGSRQADFIDCVAWRQTAEFVSRYFSKGKMIGIIGMRSNRTHINLVFTKKEYHRRGVATSIFQYLLADTSEIRNVSLL